MQIDNDVNGYNKRIAYGLRKIAQDYENGIGLLMGYSEALEDEALKVVEIIDDIDAEKLAEHIDDVQSFYQQMLHGEIIINKGGK